MTPGGPSAARPRATFGCLWCGRPWTVRGPDDLEGYAQLCPDCLGKAGDNAFLRFRLKAALEARAAVGGAVAAPSDRAAREPGDTTPAAPDAPAADDDWYLRRGRHERGPIHDAAWNAELDAAGRWLDGLPIEGRVVELAAGSGWWSPLLAGKGELWVFDAADDGLERGRERLLAHRLRAHIHTRDPWAEPQSPPAPADALFAGFWLGRVERDRTAAWLELAGRWLAPGGRLAIIESAPDPGAGAVGRGTVHRTADEIARALAAAGFVDVDVSTTGRFFVLATARAG